MAKRAADFVWAAGALADMGYTEVNLNLGCPSGTVTAKGKGSGFLRDPEGLDLSAVTEFKVTDKGGVEVKLADRVRALETLCSLLEDSGGRGAEALYRALSEGCGEGEEGWGDG